MITRIIAVDWSGALADTRKIWLADVRDGECAHLQTMTRDAVAAYLINAVQHNPDVVVGLDFAFSFPEWFPRRHAARSAHEIWCLAERDGEAWLRTCEEPFFGRKGSRRPSVELFRRAERDFAPIAGVAPKSVFQIGGAGAVGTGSIRGMPHLSRLHDAGFSVWPFDPPSLPAVIEIYPRIFTGPVRKSDPQARAEHLRRYDELTPEHRAAAEASEDAFDALVSALVMWRSRDQLATLPPARDDLERIEGAIWVPSTA